MTRRPRIRSGASARPAGARAGRGCDLRRPGRQGSAALPSHTAFPALPGRPKRLPRRGAGARRDQGQEPALVVGAEVVAGRRCGLRRAGLPPEDRPIPRTPASGTPGARAVGSGRVRACTHRPGAQSAGKEATPPRSAGASDPAVARLPPVGELAFCAIRGRRCPMFMSAETVPGAVFPHERGRSSTGRPACPAQPGVGGGGEAPHSARAVAPAAARWSHPLRPVAQSDRAAPAPAGAGWHFAPSGAGAALCRCVLRRSPGNRSRMSGAVLPLEDRPFPLSPTVLGSDQNVSVGRGHRPCRRAAVPPTLPGRPKRAGSACPCRGLALRAIRGRRCPLPVPVEAVPGVTFPHERGRSSTGRSACPAQPDVGGGDGDAPAAGGRDAAVAEQSQQDRPAPKPPGGS